MKFGIALRSMGSASEPDVLVACARAAEAVGIDDLWIQDHLAIPPDDAEGSNGRYLDPMTTLAWLAPQTERIGLCTGVLILPYRRPLPMAKAVATVQELSGGRVKLGIGVGWMKSEFAALGISRGRRGADTDSALDLLRRGFGAADDIVEEHGQAFLFRPKPPAPPIYVGGHGEHALRRAVRYGDGWLPMGADPEKLAPAIARLGELAKSAGKERPEVFAMGPMPKGSAEEAADKVRALGKVGVSGLIAGVERYDRTEEFRFWARNLAAIRDAFES